MGIRDWLSRVVGWVGTEPQKAAAVRVEPEESRPARNMIASFFWGQLPQEWAKRYAARLLSTGSHELGDDLLLLPWLTHRIYDLWRRNQPQTPVEEEVLRCVEAAHVAGQRIPLPPEYCAGREVFLLDLEWRNGTLEDLLDPFDPNRAMLKLRPAAGSTVGQWRPLIPRAGAAMRWARRRLRVLRSRGAVQVTAMRVQANYRLYEPGDDDHPGVVIFPPRLRRTWTSWPSWPNRSTRHATERPSRSRTWPRL
jgi:hypothetical protein